MPLLAIQLAAIAGIWILWDFRIAATFALVLVVLDALRGRQTTVKALEVEVPTLTTPAAAAPPGSDQRPGSGQPQA